jgi:hypothetical protein
VSTQPWQKPRDRAPVKTTLMRWRKLADEQARAKGAAWACNICKRAMGTAGQREMRDLPGYLWMRRPAKATSSPLKRRICLNCYVSIASFVAEMEAQGARSELPPEVLEADEESE